MQIALIRKRKPEKTKDPSPLAPFLSYPHRLEGSSLEVRASEKKLGSGEEAGASSRKRDAERKMIHCLRYENPVRFNSIHAIRIHSLPNPLQKCHYGTNPQSSLAEYLQTSLGFSPERAPEIVKILKGYNPGNPDAVITFFKSYGLSETHIKSIIDRVPTLLFYVPESRLRPKIQFLKDKGISESDIVDLMVALPHFFTRSLDGYIKPLLDLLSSILGTHESAVQFLIRKRYIFNLDTCSSNMAILRNYGVLDQHISRLLRQSPRALAMKSDSFHKFLDTVKEMGFKPESVLFIDAIRAMVSLSSQTWDAKIKVYTSLGWSAEEVLSIFRKKPGLMTISEEKIRKGVDYMTKELGWSPSYIFRYPIMLTHSLEKGLSPGTGFFNSWLPRV
ncbi:hypothetical protein ACLOJK_025005 [Asimina triloba]